MKIRAKVAAVGLGVVTMVAGTVAPAAAVEKVAGCDQSVWGQPDKAGRLSEPTRYRIYIKGYKYCVTIKTYASGAKPLRATQTDTYHDGLCNSTTKSTSISKYGYKLAGRGGRGAYTRLKLSDGAVSKSFRIGGGPTAC